MQRGKFRQMEAEDERQFMLAENYEIMEKNGVPVGAVQMHSHDFYELLYIEAGEMAYHVDNRLYRLREGDFVLINRNSLHHYQLIADGPEKSSRRILLWVTREYMQQLSGERVDLSACFCRGESPVWHFPRRHSRMLVSFLAELAGLQESAQEEQGENDLIGRSYMTLFFVTLNRLCRDPAFLSRDVELVYDPMAAQVLAYIDDHLERSLTVEELAEQVALSKYYFLRRFYAATGMTAHEVVMKKRLMYACRLMEEGMSVSEAWGKCGYRDYSSFFRKFKKEFGVSPKEFQKRCSESMTAT